MKTALLVIDVQNDFIDGTLPVHDGVNGVQDINNYIEENESTFDLIVFTKDWHPKNHTSFSSNHENSNPFDIIDLPYGKQVLWPDHCIQNEKGSEFHPDLYNNENVIVVTKGSNPNFDSYSGFKDAGGELTELHQILQNNNIEKVICVGYATDYCVKATAMDAITFDYLTVVVKDCCRPVTLEGEQPALDEMAENGIVIISSKKDE
eukprot:TRINITY_DN12699_c0_g1_i1.p1 TRINITY_DN12699_c0_g1~~TRINITY_DN12699_c0_g1_i1.p1  ORF type:complete len:206 (-),score=68.43 TRINITY_DN12699_c0_g1_i1:44-661(-)